MRVYVGTYTRGDTGSEGIYRAELDVASGELTVRGVAARAANPSFLALSAAVLILIGHENITMLLGYKTGKNVQNLRSSKARIYFFRWQKVRG